MNILTSSIMLKALSFRVNFLGETSELYKILVNVIHTENKCQYFHTLKNQDEFIFTLYLLYSVPEIQNFSLVT